ncbi:MAG: pilus assembly protein PilM [Selenomonadaceae bacterium]|nr:pilus assembly protein PilM [Selenomonadaceae bacterium]MBQ3725698.1 pilus assembly protein PilM [Selenomonadaceae bacterium]
MTDKIIDEELKPEEKPRRTRSKKISADEKPKRGRQKKSAEVKPKRTRKKIDYKTDGKEKIFALDIGTRSVIGIVAEQDDDGQMKIIATHRLEHTSRAMLDGQIHDVPQVAEVIIRVKNFLAEQVGELKSAAIAAAGRALYTMTAEATLEVNGVITDEVQSSLNFAAVQLAQSQLTAEKKIDAKIYYCVGFSIINYELDGIRLKSLIGQRGKVAKTKVIATFLPRQVVDSMQTALTYAGLEVRALTLEPIAAINVLVPPSMRHLNIVLVDIGAGTSDVAITKNGSVIAYGMVPLAGDEVTEAISQRFLLDFNVAEEIKRKATNGEGATFSDILGRPYDLTAEEILMPINENVGMIANAIAKTIFELNGNDPPQALLLVGGGALSPNLNKLVAEALNMPLERVAVRKPDKVEGIKNIPAALQAPDAATPLGILKVASTDSFHFFNVMINGQEVNLFHFRDLTVSDAILSAGIDYKKFNGKPGLGLVVTVDGEKKSFPGTLGTFAKIFVNDEPATLDTPIQDNCRIKIQSGEDGVSAQIKIDDIVAVAPSFTVTVNGKEFSVAPKLLVNGEVSLPSRILQDGDELNTKTRRNVGELLRLANYPPAGKKIRYTLNGSKAHYTCTPDIFLNGDRADVSDVPKAGDAIEYVANDAIKVGEIVKDESRASAVKIFYNGKEYSIPTTATVLLSVNGRVSNENTIVEDGAEIIFEREEKNFVMVSDALLAVNFKPPPAKSRMSFVIKINGKPAEFADPVKSGDELEIILKTPDGLEFKPLDDLETPVRNEPQKKFSLGDFLRAD